MCKAWPVQCGGSVTVAVQRDGFETISALRRAGSLGGRDFCVQVYTVPLSYRMNVIDQLSKLLA